MPNLKKLSKEQLEKRLKRLLSAEHNALIKSPQITPRDDKRAIRITDTIEQLEDLKK